MSSFPKRNHPAPAWAISAPLCAHRKKKSIQKCSVHATANAPDIAKVANATEGTDGGDGDAKLGDEARQWADSAVAAQVALERGGSVTGAQLVAFLSVKGVTVGCNVWETERLLGRAQRYLKDERVSRLREGAGWDELSDNSRASMLHTLCNSEGDATYIDPATGYTVFSAFGHLRRGNCCGVTNTDDGSSKDRSHRCRHCPYDDAGTLKSSKWQSLSRRIQVVEYVRDGVQRAQNIAPTTIDVNESVVPISAINLGGAIPTTTIKGNNNNNRINRIGTITEDGLLAAALGANLEGFKHKMNDAQLATLLPKPKVDVDCADCQDRKVTRCTRCAGWRILITPRTALCPQCDAKGYHPCIRCTGWRPPAIKSFGG